jgi:WD40 repeat protein/tetratricopeptide (TPR) repeat protein
MSADTTRRTNPFPGLRPFRTDEHHLFFGREEQTVALLQLLRKHRFLAVVGTSGSGKSSLVRAGLIAELHGGTMTRAGSSWEVIILRPGGSPIENLAQGMIDADLYDRDEPSALLRLLATLNRSRFGLVEAARQSDSFNPGTNLLVVVDQFEELFRFRQQGISSEEEATAFVNLLLSASEQQDQPIFVAITMRSDYLGDCSEIPGLAEAVNDGEYLIPRLSRDQKRLAIEQPIGVGGATISARLVQRLLNDVGDDPDQLPVLQHALMRMWDVWLASGDSKRPLDFQDFEAIGGLDSALSVHADEIYAALPDDRHRAVAARIFKTLTERGPDNRGIRRPTRLDRLERIAEVDRATALAILDAFRRPGVTFLMPDLDKELEARTVVDLSHESLMRCWQRLRAWVEEEAQSARIFRRLADTAELRREGKAGLFHDPDLQIALSWREQQQPNAAWAEQYGGEFEIAVAFLEASSAAVAAETEAREVARQHELDQARQLAEARQGQLLQQQRSARKLRSMLAGLAVVAAIAVGASVVASTFWREASRAKAVAEEHADTAKTQAQFATEQQALAEKRLGEANAAREAARRADRERRIHFYASDMKLTSILWEDDRNGSDQLRARLAAHIPDPKDPETIDLRGFEWHYRQHLFDHGAAVISGLENPADDLALTADERVLALDAEGRLGRWNIETREPIGPRSDLGKDAVLSSDGRLAVVLGKRELELVDANTGKTLRTLDGFDPSQFVGQIEGNRFSGLRSQLIFSRDGKYLVGWGRGGDQVQWVDTTTGEIAATGTLKTRLWGVRVAAVSSDGLTLAVAHTGSGAGSKITTVRWNREQQKVEDDRSWEANTGTLGILAFTPDDRSLLFANYYGGTIYKSDVGSEKKFELKAFAHAAPISAIAIGPNGTLATAAEDGTIKIWTGTEKLEPKSTLRGHRGRVEKLHFSPSGQLVSAGSDKTIRIWADAKVDSGMRPLDPAGIHPARYSPDGLLIAARIRTSEGVRPALWDAVTGNLVRTFLSDDAGEAQGVAFSPDRKTLAVGYGFRDGVSHVVLWDIETGRRMAQFAGTTDLPGFQTNFNTGNVFALAFSPDGKHLVAGFGRPYNYPRSGTPTPLKVWNLKTSQVRLLSGHTNFCISVEFSPDGARLASASYDGTVRIWNTTSWETEQTLKNPDPPTSTGNGRVASAVFSPDGRHLAMASHEGSVAVWETGSWNQPQILVGHTDAVRSLAFSHDSRALASGGNDGTIRIWNVATWRELLALDLKSTEASRAESLEFSPDGRRLLAGMNALAIWTTTPLLLWDDPDNSAKALAGVLDSGADFRTRVRWMSTSPNLHRGLEILAGQRPSDARVRTALAATRAHDFAARGQWAAAVEAFDQLKGTNPGELAEWLDISAVLRVARALDETGRPADAAILLAATERRRHQDGLESVVTRLGVLGFNHKMEADGATITGFSPGSPARTGGLREGDRVTAVNGTAWTNETTEADVARMLNQGGVRSVRLTVKRPGQVMPRELLVNRRPERLGYRDTSLFHDWISSIEAKLATNPSDSGRIELRAELNALAWRSSDTTADYAAALAALRDQPAERMAESRKRLHRRRGDSYFARGNWKKALDDYAEVVTAETTDETLLGNQARAQAALLWEQDSVKRWTFVEPVDMTSSGGATLALQKDGSVLAGGTNPDKDTYTVRLRPGRAAVTAIRLEVLPDSSLPHRGPGRSFNSNFWLTGLALHRTAGTPDQSANPVTIKTVWVDYADTNIGGAKDVVEAILDGKDGTGWSIYPHSDQAHEAVFQLDKPIEPAGDLIIELQFRGPYVQHAIGRFRLSVNTDPNALAVAQNNHALRTHPDPWVSLAAAHRLRNDQQAVDLIVKTHPQSAAAIGALFVQNGDWTRALAICDSVITDRTVDADLLANRARAHEGLRSWDAATADWTRAAAASPEGPRLLAEFANRLSANGQGRHAASVRGAARRQYVQSLQENPSHVPAARELATLLIDTHRTDWTVLQPTEARVEQLGKLMPVESDGSIRPLTIDPNSTRARWNADLTCKVECKPALATIAALRLEVFPEATPTVGAIRPNVGVTGFMLLKSIRVDSSLSGGSPDRVRFVDAASSSRVNPLNSLYDIAATIDETRDGAWYAMPQDRVEEAIFLLSSPLTVSSERPFVVRLNGLSTTRFRLSAVGDSAVFERERTRLAVEQQMPGLVTGNIAPNRVDEMAPWLRLAGAYALNGETDRSIERFSELLDSADSSTRDGIVELASRFEGVLAGLQRRRPADAQLQVAQSRALALRGKRELAAGRPAQAETHLTEALTVVDRLRAAAGKTQWTVIDPVRTKSSAGATFTRQPDRSILVSGTIADKDTYTIEFGAVPSGTTAFRLETLPHPTLPQGGPGRAFTGNYELTGIALRRATANPEQAGDPLTIRNVWVDFSHGANRGAKNVEEALLDGKDATGWSIYSRPNQDRVAVVQLDKPIEPGGDLILELQFRGDVPQHSIGRFRLSVTGDSNAVANAGASRTLPDAELADIHLDLGKLLVQRGTPIEAAAGFHRALDSLPADQAAAFVEAAMNNDAVFAELRKLRPADPIVALGWGKRLASQGRWDEAAEVFRNAARLGDPYMPKWVQTGFWKVGPYPYDLEPSYPPEVNPDPFRPVAGTIPKTGGPPAELRWEQTNPLPPGSNAPAMQVGLISLGSQEHICIYVLTRVWSPTEQEVALQIGDDDASRLFVNNEFLLQTRFNGGRATPKEYEVLATLKPGWNTILMKVQNTWSACWALLTIGATEPDLASARRGTEAIRADRLTASGKAQDAVTLLNGWIEQHADSHRLFAARARAYQQLERWTEAVADWSRALVLQPDDREYLYERATTYTRHLKRHHRALADWNRLSQLRPSVILERAATYEALGQIGNARADLDLAVTRTNFQQFNQGQVYRTRGEFRARQGEWKNAAADLGIASRHWVDDASRADVDRDRALASLMAGDLKAYRASLAKLAEEFNDNSGTNSGRWLVYATVAGPDPIAADEHRRLLKIVTERLANDSAKWQPRLTAALLHRVGEHRAAADLFDKTPKGPDDPAFQFVAAIAHHRAGNVNRAKELVFAANAWIKAQEERMAGPATPTGHDWRTWAVCKSLQREAAAIISGKPDTVPKRSP